MNKAVFLDRDGVINRNTHYVNKPEDFEILPNVQNAIKLLHEAKYKIFVVTNQGGIEKGYIEESILYDIHHKMKLAIPEIYDIAFCPNYDSFERKPQPGMIYNLAYEYEIYTGESWFVGDMVTDCIAGKRAGCKTIMVKTDFMESIRYENDIHVDYQEDDLMEAALRILRVDGFII